MLRNSNVFNAGEIQGIPSDKYCVKKRSKSYGYVPHVQSMLRWEASSIQLEHGEDVIVGDCIIWWVLPKNWKDRIIRCMKKSQPMFIQKLFQIWVLETSHLSDQGIPIMTTA